MMEEALHQQSVAYQKGCQMLARQHTAFGRLASFASSSLPIDCVEKLADVGVYMNSSVLQSFRHYRKHEHQCADFNDQNVSQRMAKAYQEVEGNPNLWG